MTDDLEFETLEDNPEILLFLDTETTGLPNFKLPADDPAQPRVCSFAALMTDSVGKVINGFASLIVPEGWTIAPEATEVHGLTAEMCAQYGMPAAVVLAVAESMLARAARRVGHNIAFDLKMLRGELRRLGLPDHYDKTRDYCTMHKSRDVCRIPPTGKMMGANIKTWKSPSLDEAHKHFFGRPVQNAHTALADVKACKDIYFALNPVPAEPAEQEEGIAV